MPGVGHWWIILIILALALIIFGPARLPELGAGLGKAIREFRKGASEMTEHLKEESTRPADPAVATGTTYAPVDQPGAVHPAAYAPPAVPQPPVTSIPPAVPAPAPGAVPPSDPGPVKS
ncbi:MAG: twin-arginine translocase TatA/TatE family subunit [Candidatus Dormibacteria bacterium]